MHTDEARHMPLARPMLFIPSMKTRLNALVASLLFAAACSGSHNKTSTASSADFVPAAPQRHIDRGLVAAPEANSRIQPLDVLTFEHDKTILSESSLSQLDAAAHWLKTHPRYSIVIEGHADATGYSAYNEDLAMRRINAVRQRLLQYGIANRRMMMINFGDREAMDETNPLMGADRQVVMYATTLAPRQVAAMVRENRPAIVAVWVERGAIMELRNNLTVPTQTVRR
jgi:peptidoglycan-associated lipoprotein